MTKEQYLARRQELLNNARKEITNGNLEEANTLRGQVEALDSQYEEIVQAQANLDALNNVPNLPDLTNNVNEPQNTTVVGVHNTKVTNNTYEDTWAKFMMGQPLNSAEMNVMAQNNKDFSNEYTHTTENTEVMIPNTVLSGIMGLVKETYPMYADAKKLNIRGTITIPKHNAIIAGDADSYAEDTETVLEENEFGVITLSGHEVSKAVEVSWKLKKMAVPEFLEYIKTELGERIAAVIGMWVARGNGVTQPEGVVTALKAQVTTPQVLEYEVAPTYKQMKNFMSRLHASYTTGAFIYANNHTVWNVLADIQDGTGKDAFISDSTQGGVGRIFGFTVKVDAGLADGDVVLGNMARGYKFNTNEQINVVTEEKARKRVTDYVGYGIVDGAVVDESAFALMTKKAEVLP